MNEDDVRAATAQLDSAVRDLSDEGVRSDSPDLAPLQAAWNRLVTALVLGPAPRMRDCPRCGRSVRAAATLCGYCWEALAPTG